MAETFVVLWRASVRGRWQVQPFVFTEAAAKIVGRRLVEQFNGEACYSQIHAPSPGEDFKVFMERDDGEVQAQALRD